MLPRYDPELYCSLLAEAEPPEPGRACILVQGEWGYSQLDGVGGARYTLETVWEDASALVGDKEEDELVYVVSNEGGRLRLYLCGIEDYLELRDYPPLRRTPLRRLSPLAA